MLAHALDGHELLRRGLQHMAQVPEMLQQPVGDGIRVIPGIGEEQQQLQGMKLLEMIQSLVQEPIFHPPSVFCVHIHGTTSFCLQFCKKRVQ